MPRTVNTAAVKKRVSKSSGRSKRVKASEALTDTNQNEILPLATEDTSNRDEHPNLFSGPHPMLIPMLVSLTINYLNPSLHSLKQLRLVCKTWYEASLFLWRRKSAVLTIVPDSSAFIKPDSQGLQFSTFLQIYQDPFSSLYRFAQRPYSKYKLKDFTIDINVCDGESQGQQAKLFWDNIGPLMEYVHFEKCTFLQNVDFPFHQLLIRKIPNLIDLALSKVELQRVPLGEWMELLDISRFNQKSHPTLKSLVVYQEIHMKFAELIGLPLKSAELNLTPFPKPLSIYHELPILTGAVENNGRFFKSVAGSLENLKIFLPPLNIQNSAICLTTETMGCLRELHLFGPVCGNFEFLQFTPVLEKLCIDLGCYGKREEIRKMIEDSRNGGTAVFRYDNNKRDMTLGFGGMEDGFSVGNLNHLEIDFEFKERGLRLIGICMPGLRVLKSVLSEKTIGVVGEFWGEGLVELGCGFGSKVENKMFYAGEFKHVRSRDKKNISDLKRLERFQFDAFCGRSKLTDLAVTRGLLKMGTLKFVQICVGPKMSEKAEQDLKAAIGECRVIRNYSVEDGGGDHSNYDCCSRRVFMEEGQAVNNGIMGAAGQG